MADTERPFSHGESLLHCGVARVTYVARHPQVLGKHVVLDGGEPYVVSECHLRRLPRSIEEIAAEYASMFRECEDYPVCGGCTVKTCNATDCAEAITSALIEAALTEYAEAHHE